MVETSLFPRPHFATFLQSDDGGDPLSYYQYQRLQRLQKVARLQERRSRSYEPGYKKASAHQQSPATGQHDPAQNFAERASESKGRSRQIFKKPNAEFVRTGGPAPEDQNDQVPQLARKSWLSEKEREAGKTVNKVLGWTEDRSCVAAPSASGVSKLPAPSGDRKSEEREASESREVRPPPAVRRFSRTVKSAHLPGVQPSLAKSVFTRPKTAGVETRDVGTLTATACELGKREGASKPDREDSVKVVDLDSEHHTAADVGSEYVERLKESMAQNYHWTTATQRAYNEIDWAELATPAPPPPPSTVEQFPDPVSQRLTFRRYHSCPEPWQVHGSEWDWVQSRLGDYQHLQPVNFRAPSSYNQHIPGYTGCLAGNGAVLEHPLLSKLLVRRLTPHPTKISKKANIPGYTGHTHWAGSRPAHSDLGHPNPLTTARIHRELPLEDDSSPFRRTSPMSKAITLVSPYNPFNKIEY